MAGLLDMSPAELADDFAAFCAEFGFEDADRPPGATGHAWKLAGSVYETVMAFTVEGHDRDAVRMSHLLDAGQRFGMVSESVGVRLWGLARKWTPAFDYVKVGNGWCVAGRRWKPSMAYDTVEVPDAG